MTQKDIYNHMLVYCYHSSIVVSKQSVLKVGQVNMASNRRPESATLFSTTLQYSTLRKSVVNNRSKFVDNAEVMESLHEKFKRAGWISKTSKQFSFFDLTSVLLKETKSDSRQCYVFKQMLAEVGLEYILSNSKVDEGSPSTRKSKEPTPSQATTTPAYKDESVQHKETVDQCTKQIQGGQCGETQAQTQDPDQPKPKPTVNTTLEKKRDLSKRRDSAIGEEQIQPPTLVMKGELGEPVPEICSYNSTSSSPQLDYIEPPNLEVSPEECTSEQIKKLLKQEMVIPSQGFTPQEYETRIKKLEQQLKSEKEEKQTLGQDHKKLSEEVRNADQIMKEKLHVKESELEEYKMKLTKLESENQVEREQLVQRIAILEKKIDDMKKENETELLKLQLRLEQADSRNKEKDNNIMFLKSVIKDLQHEKALALKDEEIRKLKESQKPKEIQ